MTVKRTAEANRAVVGAFVGVFAYWACVLGMECLVSEANEAIVLPAYWMASLAVVAGCAVGVVGRTIRDVPGEIGVSASVWRGGLWGMAMTLPLPLGLAVLGDSRPLGPMDLARWVEARPFAFFDAWLMAGIVEESVYRGWFLGQLVRRGGWSVRSGLVVQGLVFGFSHVRAGFDVSMFDALQRVAMSAAGGLLMGALVVAWDWNLWVAVCWHAGIDFWALVHPGYRVTDGPMLASLAIAMGLSTGAIVWRRRARGRGYRSPASYGHAASTGGRQCD